MFGSETALIISDEEIYDIIEIVKSLEDLCLLIKGFSKTIKNKLKKQIGGFFGVLLDILTANLLESIIAGIGVFKSWWGNKQSRPGFSIQPNPSSNFEIQKYYENEPKLNDFHPRIILPKIKDGQYVLNLGEYNANGTHSRALYLNGNNVTYFDSFGVQYILKKFKNSQEITILQQTFTKYKQTIQ